MDGSDVDPCERIGEGERERERESERDRESKRERERERRFQQVVGFLSVLFTQPEGSSLPEAEPLDPEYTRLLMHHFGSVGAAYYWCERSKGQCMLRLCNVRALFIAGECIMTLFQSTTAGLDWREAADQHWRKYEPVGTQKHLPVGVPFGCGSKPMGSHFGW